ncbi:MAG: hypothetical protein COW01_06165 [Bdellovibrionales bacterium CG12_big_fil_rev_8_21_14_0_65_38_15]|nr:MAG: hypothetical protein COW79_04060 [Bdellovibrionales bacterium CG22_combo_CG10-13_8_21_14_all_38_13]PIQ56013.1 MAG: hypothetical protein COW01_06165 [Bdellovibrionales bacterium CG12_big_fil_rev_8_21_14_0_65_38_15]PIR30618.1 MAG: hypothetical protein COV38_04705 [Bdellovibrionales bacterium CG11_big_fil_rev_8_21_14_0_20_38_13]
MLSKVAYNKKYLIAFLLALLITFLFFTFNNSYYEKIDIKIKVSKDLIQTQKPILRIYTSKNKEKFNEYFILENNAITIFDTKIYAICIKKNSQTNPQIFIGESLIHLHPVESSECSYESRDIEFGQKYSGGKPLVINIFCSVLVCLFGLSFLILLENIKKDKTLEMLIVSLVSILVLLIWRQVTSPLLFDYDLIESLNEAYSYQFSNWFSSFLSLVLISYKKIGFSISDIGLINSYISVCFYIAYYKLLKHLEVKKSYRYGSLLIWVLPSVGIMINFFSRDYYAALGLLTLSFVLIKILMSHQSQSGQSKLFLALLPVTIAFVFEIRQELSVVTIIFFLILYLTKKIELKKLSILVIASMILVLISMSIKSTLINEIKTNRAKVVATLENYVDAIVGSERYVTTSHMAERINLYYGKRANVEKYFDNGFNREIKDNQFNEIKSIAWNIVQNNWQIFLFNKLQTTLSYIGYGKNKIYVYGDNFKFYKKQNYHAPNSNKFMFHQFEDKFQFGEPFRNFAKLVISSSKIEIVYTLFFPSIIITVFLILGGRIVPILYPLAMLFTRVPIIILLAPSPQLKYLYDVYLFSFLAIPIALHLLTCPPTRGRRCKPHENL